MIHGLWVKVKILVKLKLSELIRHPHYKDIIIIGYYFRVINRYKYIQLSKPTVFNLIISRAGDISNKYKVF